jgi:hypothetical protein
MLARPSGYTLRYVPREEILGLWETIGPLLNRPSERTPGIRNANNILDDALDGFAMLWVVSPDSNPGHIVMAMETKRLDTPVGPICELVSLGGEDMGKWFDTVLEQLEALAKAEGFARIRAVGRPGWKRLMAEYRMIAVVLEKRL